MGKISPVVAKYIIHVSISIEGSVDKPDVIGAIFGQTEGLLGTELDLRELQSSGKIGRIEVKIDTREGKSTGTIIIPSSLDVAETAIIAAAIETIQRIGPCDSKLKIEKIEDVRIAKRDFVVSRAKELLSTFTKEILPDSQELTDEVSQSVKVMDVIEYGKERLAAGPDIDTSEEIIIVEGRADVVTLLKNGIKNAIAINGTSVPETIKELSRKKDVIVFLDGDRGGDLILRELMSTCEIDFVARAPDGKEVEELAKKEIHKALRSKIAAGQLKLNKKPQKFGDKKESYKENNRREKPYQRPRFEQRFEPRYKKIDLQKKDKALLKEMLTDLVGTRGAFILDKTLTILGKVPTAELTATLAELKDVYAVVLDGQITKEIAQAAESKNVKILLAMNTKINQNETRVHILIEKDLE